MPDAPSPLSEGIATSENSHVTTGSQHAQYVSYSGAAMAAAVFAYADKLYAWERLACIFAAVGLVVMGLMIRAFLAYNYARFRTQIKVEAIKNPASTPVPMQLLAKAAPLVLLAFLLVGCASTADPSLNAALVDAQKRVANATSARAQIADVEDQHLINAQNSAIAFEVQVGVDRASQIAKQKSLSPEELAKEIARQYHVAFTKQQQVAQNLAMLKAVRGSFDSDINSANAEIEIVKAANSQKQVSATQLATTVIQAIAPVVKPPSTAPPMITFNTSPATAAEVVPLPSK